jgi:hypothetical protein
MKEAIDHLTSRYLVLAKDEYIIRQDKYTRVYICSICNKLSTKTTESFIEFDILTAAVMTSSVF